MQITAPQSEQELLQRCHNIAGLTLLELATKTGATLPKDLLHAKGWAGQLLETYLGATAGCKAEPDFLEIGIELKTIPVNADGSPRESTYVCHVPMKDHVGITWHESTVYKKLAKVLWIPIEAEPSIPLSHRKVGMPLLWQPSANQEAALRQDWEELMEIIALGKVESITAHHGVYLQIRPKAADSHVKTLGIGVEGEQIQTLPRGFYLRTVFTKQILNEHYF